MTLSREAFTQAERSPQLREELAAAYEEARTWVASLRFKTDPNTIDEVTLRTVGSFLLALQAGLAAQWLLDPAHSPSGDDLAVALRAICGAAEPLEAGPVPRRVP